MSVTLLLVAVISITTATYAWFTLTNSTVVHNMTVEVSTGTTLKANTVPGATLTAYESEITNEMVNAQLLKKYKYELSARTGVEALKLYPVTSGDGLNLYTQSKNTVATAPGNGPEDGYYLQLTLWFMADKDMDVYLNGDNSPGCDPATPDGTSLFSEPKKNVTQSFAEQAARMSVTPYSIKSGGNYTLEADYTVKGDTVIFEPEIAADVKVYGNAAVDIGGNRVTGKKQVTFDQLGNNAGTMPTGGTVRTPVLFSLAANVPKMAVFRIWLEGEDPQCVNGNGVGAANKPIDLPGEKLVTRLRFCGANADGSYME